MNTDHETLNLHKTWKFSNLRLNVVTMIQKSRIAASLDSINIISEISMYSLMLLWDHAADDVDDAGNDEFEFQCSGKILTQRFMITPVRLFIRRLIYYCNSFLRILIKLISVVCVGYISCLPSRDRDIRVSGSAERLCIY
jgi:hypothetical protein